MKFQVMPELSTDEYAELKADIAKNGVVVPVLVDEDGNIIDGHNRVQIASELRIPYPVEMRDDLDDAGKRGLAFALNLNRRHLNREQKRELIARSLKADPQLPNLEHSRRTGTSDKTVASVRSELESHSEIPNDVPRLNSRGQERPASYQRSSGPERKPIADLPATAPITPEEVTELKTQHRQTTDAEPEQTTTAQKPDTATPATEHTPRAQAITTQFSAAVSDLNKVLNKFHRITTDGNFNRNKNQVATLHGNDLARAIGELQQLADNLK